MYTISVRIVQSAARFDSSRVLSRVATLSPEKNNRELLQIALAGVKVSRGRVARPLRVRYDAQDTDARGHRTGHWTGDCVSVQSILETGRWTELTGYRTGDHRHGTGYFRYRTGPRWQRIRLYRYWTGLIGHWGGFFCYQAGLIRHRAGLIRHRAGLIRHRAGLNRHRAGLNRHRPWLNRHWAGLKRHRAGLNRHWAGLTGLSLGARASHRHRLRLRTRRYSLAPLPGSGDCDTEARSVGGLRSGGGGAAGC